MITLTIILSDNTLVPPVTELLSPPASRITGADSPVIALSSMLAKPSIISPSVGIVSPITQINTSPFFNCADDMIFPSNNLAGVSSLVLRKLSAWAFPRASAIDSAKLAKSRVKNNTRKTIKLYPKLPCDVSPVNVHKHTMNIIIVAISTVNMMGFRYIILGFSFTNDCTIDCCISSF